MKPLISVIVPIYKVEPYLRQCLDSIVNQTYTNLEIILVDDGSPDGCPAICDEYAAKDNRIVVIHKENGGLSDARNAGLDICKGEYISFVDSDDWIADCFIETLQESAFEHQSDISIVSYQKVPGKQTNNTKKDFTTYNSHELLYHLCASDVKGIMSAWGKLFHKSCFKTIRFPLGKLYEDAHINYKIYFNAKKISYSSQELYFYRIRSDSIMGQTTSSVHALEPLFQRYLFLKEHGETEAANCNIVSLCGDFLYAYSEAKLYNRFPTGFDDSEHILKIYKKLVIDFFKNPSSRKTIKLFHFFFSKFPNFYLLYRKFAPIHLRKN